MAFPWGSLTFLSMHLHPNHRSSSTACLCIMRPSDLSRNCHFPVACQPITLQNFACNMAYRRVCYQDNFGYVHFLQSYVCCEVTCAACLVYTIEVTWKPSSPPGFFCNFVSRDIRCKAGHDAGLLADKLIKQGWHVTRVRKTLQSVAFLGPALALIILSRSKDPRIAVACMTCALGITSLGHFLPCLPCCTVLTSTDTL